METSKLALTIWDKKVATYCKCLDMLDTNLAAQYAIIWGQCSEVMKAKLVSLTDYELHCTNNDCIWLLKEIKAIMYHFEGQQYLFHSLALARSTMEHCQQGPDESLAKYLHQFCSNVEVMEHYGGGIGCDPGLVAYIKKICTNAEALVGSWDRTLALGFLGRSNQRNFGMLITDLANQFSWGNDQYPTDLTSAYSLLVNFHVPRTHALHGPATPATNSTTGVSFAQTTSSTLPLAGSDGHLHTHITCYQCNCKGHYSSARPTPTTGVQMVQTSNFSFTQQQHGQRLIPSSWVLLDSQSTVSIFNNPGLLRNIHMGTSTHSTGGVQSLYLIGDIPNFG